MVIPRDSCSSEADEKTLVVGFGGFVEILPIQWRGVSATRNPLVDRCADDRQEQINEDNPYNPI